MKKRNVLMIIAITAILLTTATVAALYFRSKQDDADKKEPTPTVNPENKETVNSPPVVVDPEEPVIPVVTVAEKLTATKLTDPIGTVGKSINAKTDFSIILAQKTDKAVKVREESFVNGKKTSKDIFGYNEVAKLEPNTWDNYRIVNPNVVSDKLGTTFYYSTPKGIFTYDRVSNIKTQIVKDINPGNRGFVPEVREHSQNNPQVIYTPTYAYGKDKLTDTFFFNNLILSPNEEYLIIDHALYEFSRYSILDLKPTSKRIITHKYRSRDLLWSNNSHAYGVGTRGAYSNEGVTRLVLGPKVIEEDISNFLEVTINRIGTVHSVSDNEIIYLSRKIKYEPKGVEEYHYLQTNYNIIFANLKTGTKRNIGETSAIWPTTYTVENGDSKLTILQFREKNKEYVGTYDHKTGKLKKIAPLSDGRYLQDISFVDEDMLVIVVANERYTEGVGGFPANKVTQSVSLIDLDAKKVAYERTLAYGEKLLGVSR